MNYLKNAISLIFLLIVTMCGEPDPPVTNNETCMDGIKNQGETDIDCGGPCIECFDCFSDYCVYLSGGTFLDPSASVTWSWTLVNEVPVSELDPGNIINLWYMLQKFKFSNKGKLTFTGAASGTSGDGTDTEDWEGRWRFDDASNPQYLYCEFEEDVKDDMEYKIASLSSDELKVDFGDYMAVLEPE
jgi:hypothetical protein